MRLSPAAFLEFLAAAAGTKFISPDLWDGPADGLYLLRLGGLLLGRHLLGKMVVADEFFVDHIADLVYVGQPGRGAEADLEDVL